MERLFAVLRSRGPAWDDSKPLEGQAEWAGHAAFMDALFEQRFAVPLQYRGSTFQNSYGFLTAALFSSARAPDSVFAKP